MATLIKLQGGPKNFVDRLDFIIDQVREHPYCDELFQTETDLQGYFDVTDEPGQQIPFMYNYANRPGKSSQRSRQMIYQYFNTSTKGLPGNDGNSHSFPLPFTIVPSIKSFAIIRPDSGAMGSFAVFHLAGLYPVPATQHFLLSSPFFPSVSFFNPLFNTKTTIRTKNFSFHAIFIKVRYVLHVILKSAWVLTDCGCMRGDSMFVECDSRWKALEIELLPRVGHVHARRDNRARVDRGSEHTLRGLAAIVVDWWIFMIFLGEWCMQLGQADPGHATIPLRFEYTRP